jgi:hypothetical protein
MLQKLLPTLAAIALVAACASPWAVEKYAAPEADVAGARSFVWRAGEVGAPLVKQPHVAADVETRMRAAITQELQRKGYVETTDAASADMAVSFQVTGARRFVKSDERRVGAPSPNEVLTPGGMPTPPASEPSRERSVRDGIVVVFAEHPASGMLMWRGVVSAEIRASSLDRTVTQVIDMARHIAREFPARQTGP